MKILQSRNKREGWYAGRDGFGHPIRAWNRGLSLRGFRSAVGDGYVVFVYADYAKYGPVKCWKSAT